MTEELLPLHFITTEGESVPCPICNMKQPTDCPQTANDCPERETEKVTNENQQ